MHALDTPPTRRPRPAVDAARRTRTPLETLTAAVRGRLTRAHRRLAIPTSGRLRAAGREAGMATAEYAIATLAAVGFAGLLLVILKSAEVRGLLLGIITSALSVG